MSFTALPLVEPIQKALKLKGYTQPTSIQSQSIPLVLKRKDLFGCAQTGTGKTAAFLLPLIQILHQNAPSQKGKRAVRGLVLTPTRELAIQIGENLEAYSKFTNLKHTVIFGGVKQGRQTRILQSGVDVLVATPGRLLDLMNQGFIDLKSIELFVLDEADRMLDMGFIHDIKKVLKVLPKKKQSLFFSATMPDSILKLANTILVNPAKVEVNPVSSTAETVRQGIYFVPKNKKRSLLKHILTNYSIDSVLVFSRTKHGANRIVRNLSSDGIPAAAIHGNKSQNSRQRALKEFKAGTLRVLVATDIAARGIDVDQLKYVVNFDLPNIPETYVHRIGRTGRAGANGIALSFCDLEERAYLKDIEKVIGKKVPVMEENPFALSAEEMESPIQKPKQNGGRGGGRNFKRKGSSRSGGGRNKRTKFRRRSS